MTNEETIDKLWENSNHGTERKDIVAAYDAGYAQAQEEIERLKHQKTEALSRTITLEERACRAEDELAALRAAQEPVAYMVLFDAKLGGANVTDKLLIWRKEEVTRQVREELIQDVVPLYRAPFPAAPEGMLPLLVACRPSVRADLTAWEQLVERKRKAGSLNQCDEEYTQRIFDLLEKIDMLMESNTAPLPAVPEWQPIETAPKDWRRILIGRVGYPWAVSAWWHERHKH